MQPCPFCGELIQPDALKCKYCQEFLNGVQTKLKDSQPPSSILGTANSTTPQPSPANDFYWPSSTKGFPSNPTTPQPSSANNIPDTPVVDLSTQLKDGYGSVLLFVIFLFTKALLSPYINQDPNLFLSFMIYGMPGLILLIFALTFKSTPKRAIYGAIVIGILETIDFAIGTGNSLTTPGANHNIIAPIVWGTVRAGALTSLFKGAL